LAGSAPAVVALPEGPFVEVPVMEPPTVLLFALRSVRWRDQNGEQRIGAQCSDVYLTPQAARRALAIGACVEIADPRRKELAGAQGGHPNPAYTTDLDESEAEPVASDTLRPEPIFTVVDRGPDRIIHHREVSAR